MVKTIPVSGGKFHALVDDEDYEVLSKFKWTYSKRGHNKSSGYAYRHIRTEGPGYKVKSIMLHTQILRTPEGLHGYHINGEGLDNRRTNLRVCTQGETNRNKRVFSGSSKYKGVYWYKKSGGWKSKITINYKQIHLGTFSDEKSAAIAYNKAAKEHFGEFALLNKV